MKTHDQETVAFFKVQHITFMTKLEYVVILKGSGVECVAVAREVKKMKKEIVSQHISAITSKDDHSLPISSYYYKVFCRLDCPMLQTLSTPVLLAATPITK